jgi:hypothetical protein
VNDTKKKAINISLEHKRTEGPAANRSGGMTTVVKYRVSAALMCHERDVMSSNLAVI